MAARLSSEQYIQLGKQASREKDYEKAIEHFVKALNLARGSTLEILDHLASLSDKAGQFEISLKYGKQMIQQYDSDARGYLRIGRTLQGQEKESYLAKEVAIYDRGLAKVPDSDPRHQLLNVMRHMASRRLCPPSAYDPMTVFPPEVAQLILEFLDFRQMVRCTGVSRGWKQYITSIPSLWREVDVSGGNPRKLAPKFLSGCVNRSKKQITAINLGRYSIKSIIVNLAYHCKSLNSISLASESTLGGESLVQLLRTSKSLRTLIAPIMLSTDAINRLLTEGTQLSHIHLAWDLLPSRVPLFQCTTSLPNLRILKIQGISARSRSAMFPQFNEFVKYIPNLETLDLAQISLVGPLVDLYPIRHLRSLTLRSLNIDSQLRLPDTLEYLSLDKIIGTGNFIDEENPPMLKLKHLELLQVYNTVDILYRLLRTSPHSDHSSSSASKLSALKIVGFDWKDNVLYAQLFATPWKAIFAHERVQDVQKIMLAAPVLDNDDIVDLTDNLKKLQSISIEDAAMTGVGVKTLVQTQKHLQELVFFNCVQISDDAIEWAKSQGIKTFHQKVMDPRGSGNGARTVRYG